VEGTTTTPDVVQIPGPPGDRFPAQVTDHLAGRHPHGPPGPGVDVQGGPIPAGGRGAHDPAGVVLSTKPRSGLDIAGPVHRVVRWHRRLIEHVPAPMALCHPVPRVPVDAVERMIARHAVVSCSAISPGRVETARIMRTIGTSHGGLLRDGAKQYREVSGQETGSRSAFALARAPGKTTLATPCRAFTSIAARVSRVEGTTTTPDVVQIPGPPGDRFPAQVTDHLAGRHPHRPPGPSVDIQGGPIPAGGRGAHDPAGVVLSTR
jgi:hypothetical protein